MTISIRPPAISVTVGAAAVRAGFGAPVARDLVERDPYTGDYTITPGEEQTVLATDGLRMTDDITVEAIPANWCNWSWDGSVLTVY